MKRSVLAIFLFIPLTLLMPAIGFSGEPPPSGTFPGLPAYMGNVTVEWQSTNTTCYSFFYSGGDPFKVFNCGQVIIYGKLNCAHKKCMDKIITKREPITLRDSTGQPIPVSQMDFLSLQPTDMSLHGGYFTWTIPLAGPGTYFTATSFNDLSYQSETRFTVDVVVMEFKYPPLQ
jgi:hypothetical protein